jgi:tetratricopeptide (TPR) repeat protein
VAVICLALVLAVTMTRSIQGQSVSTDLDQWRNIMVESRPLYEQGRLHEAIDAMQRAVHIAENFPPQDKRLPATLDALAFLYREEGNYQAAAGLYLRAIRLWKEIGPDKGAAFSQGTDDLIETYIYAKNYREARKLLAVRLRDVEDSPSTSKDRANVLNMRGALALTEHDFYGAERFFRESLALWEKRVPEETDNLAIALMNLSQVLINTKRYDEALDNQNRALSKLEALDGKVDPLRVRALGNCAALSEKLGRLADAGVYYQRALEIAKRVFGSDHAFVGQLMVNYAVVLRELHQAANAKVLATEGHRILARSGQPGSIVDVLSLGRAR